MSRQTSSFINENSDWEYVEVDGEIDSNDDQFEYEYVYEEVEEPQMPKTNNFGDEFNDSDESSSSEESSEDNDENNASGNDRLVVSTAENKLASYPDYLKTFQPETAVEKYTLKMLSELNIPVSNLLREQDVENPCNLTIEKYLRTIPSKIESEHNAALGKRKGVEIDMVAQDHYQTLLSSGLIPVNIVDIRPMFDEYKEEWLNANFHRFTTQYMLETFGGPIMLDQLKEKAKTDDNVKLRLAKKAIDMHNENPKNKTKMIYIPDAFRKNSLKHEHITFHTSKSIVDYMFDNNKFVNYDFAEILLIDQSRIFFDIDMTSKQQDLSVFEADLMLIASIMEFIKKRNPQVDIKLCGRIDATKTFYRRAIDLVQKHFPASTNTIDKSVFINRFGLNEKEAKKIDNLKSKFLYGVMFEEIPEGTIGNDKNISAHLFISGVYFKRSSLVGLKKVIRKFVQSGKSYLDWTVYKELQQVFRHSLSGKLIKLRAPLRVKPDVRYYETTVYPQKLDCFVDDKTFRSIIDDICVKYVITIELDEQRSKRVDQIPFRILGTDKKQIDFVKKSYVFEFEEGYLFDELDKQYGSPSEKLYGYKIYRQKKLYIISILLQIGRTDEEILKLLNEHPRIRSNGSVEDTSITNDQNKRDIAYMKSLIGSSESSTSNQILEMIRKYQQNNPLDTYCTKSQTFAVEFSDMICYLQTSVMLIDGMYVWYDMGENGNLTLRQAKKKDFKEKDQYTITFYSSTDDVTRFYQMHVETILQTFSNKFPKYSSMDVISNAPNSYSTYRYPTTSSEQEKVELDPRVHQMLLNILDSDKIKENELMRRYEFVLDCLAYKLQYPGIVFTFGIILTGRQGTGKSTFFKLFEQMIGNFANATLNFENTQENFNCDDKHLLIAVYNEVNCANKDRGKIKGLIDDQFRLYNEKFLAKTKEKNVSLKFFVSNQTNLKITIKGDRRFVTFNSDKPKADEKFFSSLYVTEKNGYTQFDPDMIANFNTFLLQRDVSNFSPKLLPKDLTDDTIDINTTKDFLTLMTSVKPEFDFRAMDDYITLKQNNGVNINMSVDAELINEYPFPKLAYTTTNKFGEKVEIIPIRVLDEIVRIFKTTNSPYKFYYTELYNYWEMNELAKYIWNEKNTFERLGEGDGKFQQDLHFEMTEEMCKHYKNLIDMKPGIKSVLKLYPSC